MEFGVITGHSYLMECYDVMCYLVEVNRGCLMDVLRCIFLRFWPTRIGFLLLFAWISLFSSDSYGFSQVKIKEVSTSKKTIIIDMGVLDGLKTGKNGWLFFSNPKNPIKLKKVAFGEAIKVFPTKSYWYLRKSLAPEYLNPGQRLLLLETDSALQGLAPIKIRKKTVYLDPKRTPEEYLKSKATDKGIPEEVIRGGKFSVRSRVLNETNLPKHQHIEVTSFSKWDKKEALSLSEDGSPADHILSSRKADKGRGPQSVRKQRKAQLAENLADGAVKKGKFYKDLGELYKDIEATSLVQNGSLHPTVYDKYMRKKREEKEINSFALEKIIHEGDLWSVDMDRDQLREFFVASGIAIERERQKFALQNEVGHEIFILYGMNLNSHVDPSDKNYQGSGISLGIGYDYFLMRTSPKLNHFSLELFLDTSNNYYDFGTKNALSNEFSLKFSINWYLRLPSTLRKYIWYIGTGIGSGQASIKNASFSRNYTAQISDFPFIHLGLKYRFGGREKGDWFNKSVGLHFLISTGMRRLTVVEQITDSIEASLNVGGVKFSGGVNFLF